MKKILFLHGFYASGQCIPALALRESFEGRAEVITPDLPMHPKEAVSFIHELIEKEKPNLLIGNSCGSFYAQMVAPVVGVPALLGNPHFKMTEFLKPRIGEHQYKSPRKDGKQDFVIDETLIEEFAEMEAIQFHNCNPCSKDRVWGLFGEQDSLAHFESTFLEHYNHTFHFPGGHTPTADELRTWYVPLAEKLLMGLETERLILRSWLESDAEQLYNYAKSPQVGHIAGWPPHKNVEESLEIIRTVFSAPETYAIVLKETGLPIGCIGLKTGDATDLTSRDDECELGYWLGVPYWGRGLMPEAAREMIRHAFEDCGMRKVWCGYYDGNNRSKRVQEKCGFVHQWTTDGVDVPLMHETRKGHVSCLTKDEWMKGKSTAMRKSKRQMDATFALEVFDKAPYITVSMTRPDGTPYGLPLSLARTDDKTFYFHCAKEGEKLDCITHQPTVFLSAVTKCAPTIGPKDGSFTLQYKSATAIGKAELVTDREEKIAALRAICMRFLPHHMDAFDDAVKRSLERTAVVRITLTEPPIGKRKQYDEQGEEITNEQEQSQSRLKDDEAKPEIKNIAE